MGLVFNPNVGPDTCRVIYAVINITFCHTHLPLAYACMAILESARRGTGGATTTGPDATPPPAICQNLWGGGGRSWGGVQPRVGGGGVPAGGGGGGVCRIQGPGPAAPPCVEGVLRKHLLPWILVQNTFQCLWRRIS